MSDDIALELVGSMVGIRWWSIRENYECKERDDGLVSTPQPCQHCRDVRQHIERIETANGIPLRRPVENRYLTWIVPRVIVASTDCDSSVVCLDCVLEAVEKLRQTLWWQRPKLAALAREIYARLDAEWQRAAQEYEKQTGDKLPCGPGCAVCCKASDSETPFVSLPLRQAEAAALEEALAALPASIHILVAERVRSNYSATCLLLSPDDLCLVYDARPLWCRIFGLPGVMNCGKIPALRGAWVKRWQEAAHEARQALVGDDSFVSLQALIRRWAYNDR